jgi:predicted GIY-YIG superfamily endonuclease
MIVYCARNLASGKLYVGITRGTLAKRLTEHLRTNWTPFQRALNKYGPLCFDFSVLDQCETRAELQAKGRENIIVQDE